jgi:hypothetical protein
MQEHDEHISWRTHSGASYLVDLYNKVTTLSQVVWICMYEDVMFGDPTRPMCDTRYAISRLVSRDDAHTNCHDVVSKIRDRGQAVEIPSSGQILLGLVALARKTTCVFHLQLYALPHYYTGGYAEILCALALRVPELNTLPYIAVLHLSEPSAHSYSRHGLV